ncbi:hypothetical protein [Bradyrhizobium sp. UFLA05-112]
MALRVAELLFGDEDAPLESTTLITLRRSVQQFDRAEIGFLDAQEHYMIKLPRSRPLTSKRPKTVADHKQISKVEWYDGLDCATAHHVCRPKLLWPRSSVIRPANLEVD